MLGSKSPVFEEPGAVSKTGRDRVRIGLVGTGRIGRLHAQTLIQHIPEADLVAVTDINLDAAREVAASYDIASVANDFQAILADPTIQAVVICSSTDTHAPFIVEAAKAGKHIFCEKPIAADLAIIDNALSAVSQPGVKLMIRFNPLSPANFNRLTHPITPPGF